MEGSAEAPPDTQTSLASTVADSLSPDADRTWQSPEAFEADAGSRADAENADEMGTSAMDEMHTEMEDDVADEDEEDSQFRSASRGELEVVDVSLSGRAQRRLARHARRARIPLVSRALVVEDEFVDVEQVTNEVHDAERDRMLQMDVSSEGEDVVASSRHRGVRARRATTPTVPPATAHGATLGAAWSVNTGRLVRLQRSRASRESRESRARASGASARAAASSSRREASPAFSPPERVSNFSWSADSANAAGFEAQPSSSSRPNLADPGESLPGMLDVPLSPDRESPLPDRENTLPESWFLDPDEDAIAAPHLAEPGASGLGLSCIYVEPVRSGMEPRNCGQCHCPFGLGELRLGYTPCGVAADGRQFLPVWVHAFVCTRRARLAIRFDGEAVSFSPAVPLVDRNRLVEELRVLHESLTRQRSQPRQLCIRPWRYIPSVLQRWPVMRLNEAATPEAFRSQNSRPAWRLPSPPRRAAAGDDVPIADLLEDEPDLGARHVQEVLAQLVSGSLQQMSGGEDFDALPSVPVPPMVPNFMAYQPRLPEPEAPATSAAARLLAEVPVFRAEKKSEEPCVVCREDIQVGQMCRRLPCLHLFHRECIDQWIAVKATCPLDNLKLEEMLSQQHSLEVGEEPAPRRSRSRSPLPRTWSEPEPRSRSSWDVRFRRSRWDPEPNWRRRRAWDRAWENHAHGAHHTHHGAGSHGPPPAPPPAPPAPPPPPNVRPPAYPPPTMPMMPAVRPAFTSTAPSAPIHPPPAMPTAITVPSMPMPITLPFSVPARMLLPNPNLNHLHPGFPSIPGPGPSGSPTG